MQGQKLHLEGKKFDMLTVICLSDFTGKSKRKNRYWTCRCDCGRAKDIKGTDLVSGHSISCGCRNTSHQNRLITNKNKLIKEYPLEYYIWREMIARCTRITHPSADNYVLRGIEVCKEWCDNFDVFIKDMGPRPSVDYSIDRIKNSEGYNKENCRWATRTEQARNRRTNRFIEYKGEMKCLAEVAEILGVHSKTVLYRMKKGRL